MTHFSILKFITLPDLSFYYIKVDKDSFQILINPLYALLPHFLRALLIVYLFYLVFDSFFSDNLLFVLALSVIFLVLVCSLWACIRNWFGGENRVAWGANQKGIFLGCSCFDETRVEYPWSDIRGVVLCHTLKLFEHKQVRGERNVILIYVHEDDDRCVGTELDDFGDVTDCRGKLVSKENCHDKDLRTITKLLERLSPNQARIEYYENLCLYKNKRNQVSLIA